jgi:glyoxylate reductase
VFLQGVICMARARVFATRPLFPAAQQILNANCEMEYWTQAERISKEELLRSVKDKDGLVCLLTERVNDELLRAAPKLRIAANVAVGFDNIDLQACTKRNVVATNTPGVLDETTADFAWTLMMAVARRIGEGEALARSGAWKGWDLDQLVGADVWGKTLGVVGFGRIGRAVARRAAGFQMKVLYADSIRAPLDVESEARAEYRDLNSLLADSDFVSLHVPLTSDTRGLFDVARLSKMKPTAFLINTSRGPVIELESKKLAGAALDVYENEPFIHSGLKRPNVVLAPHIASASLETRTKMAVIAAENVVAFFRGKKPPNILNPEAWKGR